MTQYTVRQASALTGVPPATLRAWERRYAVVQPARTESRYRLYDDTEIVRLTRMAELVAGGTPASLAAAEVTRSLRMLATSFDGDSSAAEGDAAEALGSQSGPGTGLVQAARSFDPVRLDRVLDEAFAGGSFEQVVDAWLMPALRNLGAAWSEGQIDVAGEHFVSGAVQRRLANWFEAAGVRSGSPVVVVGMPAGCFHQLAALAFATCLRRQGADVRYLGADVPTEGWVHTVSHLRPAVVVIGVPTVSDVSSATEAVKAVLGSTAVFVGGAAASEVAAATGAISLPAPLVQATAAVVALLNPVAPQGATT